MAQFRFINNYEKVEEAEENGIPLEPEITYSEGDFLISDLSRYWIYEEYGEKLLTLIFKDNHSATIKYSKEAHQRFKKYFKIMNHNPIVN